MHFKNGKQEKFFQRTACPFVSLQIQLKNWDLQGHERTINFELSSIRAPKDINVKCQIHKTFFEMKMSGNRELYLLQIAKHLNFCIAPKDWISENRRVTFADIENFLTLSQATGYRSPSRYRSGC